MLKLIISLNTKEMSMKKVLKNIMKMTLELLRMLINFMIIVQGRIIILIKRVKMELMVKMIKIIHPHHLSLAATKRKLQQISSPLKKSHASQQNKNKQIEFKKKNDHKLN